jgi:ribosomal protein S18 acetylase RimI-like enzyme
MFLLDANQNDIRGIAEVQVSSWQTTYVGQVPQTYLDGLSVPKREVAWREELTIPSHRLIVAEENERIKGFVSFVHSRDTDVNSSVGEVYAIYLLETVKGPGHGRALWNDAFKALKADLYRQVTLWVVDTNTVARRSYERVGLV